MHRLAKRTRYSDSGSFSSAALRIARNDGTSNSAPAFAGDGRAGISCVWARSDQMVIFGISRELCFPLARKGHCREQRCFEAFPMLRGQPPRIDHLTALGAERTTIGPTMFDALSIMMPC